MQGKINIRKTISTALAVNGVQIAAIAATLIYRYFELPGGSGNSVNMLLLFIVLTVLLTYEKYQELEQMFSR